jgi:GDPmannose 4,6-dehydratase
VNTRDRNTLIEGSVLILGGLGQDGQLLAQHLVNRGKNVVSIIRPKKGGTNILFRPPSTKSRLQFIEIDLLQISEIEDLIKKLKPEAIFHLATIHATRAIMESEAWNEKRKETEILHVELCQSIVSIIRDFSPLTKLIYAGSSRMFSTFNDSDVLVSEDSQMRASDFYGETKIAGHEILMNSRERHGLDFKTAILFNHESELRKNGFLFRDLAKQIAKSTKTDSPLEIWNSHARGDWHSARDTVKGIALLSNEPDLSALILCSGKPRSVFDLITEFYKHYYPEKTPVIKSSMTTGGPIILGDDSLARVKGWELTESITETLNRIVKQEVEFVQ